MLSCHEQHLGNSLGGEASAEWNVQWSELKRTRAPTKQASNTYTKLIYAAAPLAFEIVNSTRERAMKAVADCVELQMLTNPKEKARAVWASLDQSVKNSLVQVAQDYDLRMGGAGIRLRNLAITEWEKVSSHITTVTGTLEKQMTQRATRLPGQR